MAELIIHQDKIPDYQALSVRGDGRKRRKGDDQRRL